MIILTKTGAKAKHLALTPVIPSLLTRHSPQALLALLPPLQSRKILHQHLLRFLQGLGSATLHLKFSAELCHLLHGAVSYKMSVFKAIAAILFIPAAVLIDTELRFLLHRHAAALTDLYVFCFCCHISFLRLLFSPAPDFFPADK